MKITEAKILSTTAIDYKGKDFEDLRLTKATENRVSNTDVIVCTTDNGNISYLYT